MLRHSAMGNNPRGSQGGTDQFAPEKFSDQRPDEVREIRLITVGLRGSEAVVAEMKVVPFERLAVGVKTFHDPLLHRKRAVLIVPAIENQRRTLNFARRVAG